MNDTLVCTVCGTIAAPRTKIGDLCTQKNCGGTFRGRGYIEYYIQSINRNKDTGYWEAKIHRSRITNKGLEATEDAVVVQDTAREYVVRQASRIVDLLNSEGA